VIVKQTNKISRPKGEMKMRVTKAQYQINKMEKDGYKLVGQTSGLYTFRKGSNLYKEITRLGYKPEDIVVETGAHKWQGSAGWELLIFVKA
jgi:hypothetical protein